MSVVKILSITFALFLAFPGWAADGKNDCAKVLGKKLKRTLPKSSRTAQQAWTESADALKKIDARIRGRNEVINAISAAVLAEEFVWINGDPGGAKTLLSRTIFNAILKSIPEADKRIFLIQFHKLIPESKIVGAEKFKAIFEEGRTEIETSSSLVGDKYIFLIADEIEKANTATLNSLLAVLNERQALHGNQVIQAMLSSGVFTSNKTTGEFIKSFVDDQPTAEALLDRMAVKMHMMNQEFTDIETAQIFQAINTLKHEQPVLPLLDLASLVERVRIPDSIMGDIVAIARAFDRHTTGLRNETRAAVRFGERDSEEFPANQFSNRSFPKILKMFKASLLVQQLRAGVAFENIRFEATRTDLPLIATTATYMGPLGLQMKRYEVVDQENGVTVRSNNNTLVTMAAEYSPYDKKLYIKYGGKIQFTVIKTDSGWAFESSTAGYANWTIDMGSLKDLDAKIAKLIQDNKIDPAIPQFDLDRDLDVLYAKGGTGTIPAKTRQELNTIRTNLEVLRDTINQQLEKTPPVVAATPPSELRPRSRQEQRDYRRQARRAQNDPLKQVELHYEWLRQEVKLMKSRFVEMDHYIEAILTAILSNNHIYSFGPPGGAKTAVAEHIFRAVLQSVNDREKIQFTETLFKALADKQGNLLGEVLKKMKTDHPKRYDLFFQQFHKLVPEGKLTGFPKAEKLINLGIEDIEVSTSLACDKFMFAILDEVNNAAPHTLAALLSLLEEREVFAGGVLIKAGLQSAILTSNKMPSEFLDAFFGDRSTGEALMRRAINRVFIANKISTEEALVQFLIGLENGMSTKWKGVMAVNELKPLARSVRLKIDTPSDPIDISRDGSKEDDLSMITLMSIIKSTFVAQRLAVSEASEKLHREDARANPDYYVLATNGSNATTFAQLNQARARLIVHQLMNDVPFDQLRTTFILNDLNLFFEGNGYWTPQTITATHTLNDEGIVQFVQDASVLETLIASGIVDDRVSYHLGKFVEEGADYVQIVNTLVLETIGQYREHIRQFPHLFPNIILKAEDAN